MKLLGVEDRHLTSLDKNLAKMLAGPKAWLVPVLDALVSLNRPIIPMQHSCDIVIITQLRDLKTRNLSELVKQLGEVQQGRTERFAQKVVAVGAAATVVNCTRRSFGFWNLLTDSELAATREPFSHVITAPGGEFTYETWIVPRKMPVSWIELFPANSKGDVSPVATDLSSLTIPADDIRTGSKLTLFNLNAQDI